VEAWSVVFSDRTTWNVAPNRIAAAWEERRRSGLPLLDLTQSNPTRVGLPMPTAEVLAALGDSRAMRYEPTPFGHAEAREAVAAYHGGVVSPERVVLTASTSEAYGLLFKLLGDPGDRILAPVPSYPLFEYLAGLENLEVVPYPSRWEGDGWWIDLPVLEERIEARTRAILVVSPNNPTGALIRREEADRLLALCRAHGLALIADEVFADHILGDSPGRVQSLAGRNEALVFVLSGLSKVCLMPQLKAAWIAVSGPSDSVEGALQRLEVLSDTYLSVNTPVQLALPRLLGCREAIRRPLMARLTANHAALECALRGSAASLLPADGGWSAVIRVPSHPGEEERVLRLIADHGLLVHPGFFFDFPGEAFLVMSLLGPEEDLARGAAILASDADA
jgi:aspartate/methionine/tyrosine aminotransferase